MLWAAAGDFPLALPEATWGCLAMGDSPVMGSSWWRSNLERNPGRNWYNLLPAWRPHKRHSHISQYGSHMTCFQLSGLDKTPYDRCESLALRISSRPISFMTMSPRVSTSLRLGRVLSDLYPSKTRGRTNKSSGNAWLQESVCRSASVQQVQVGGLRAGSQSELGLLKGPFTRVHECVG